MPGPTKDDVIARFGFDPESVGIRHRGFWIVCKIEDEESEACAQIGDLCVKARDGGGNPPDCTASRFPNYRGTSCDGFDCTYRYYFYAPLTPAAAAVDGPP